MGGRLEEADRWSALACATTNGIGSRIFCRDGRGTLAARHRITGCSLKRSVSVQDRCAMARSAGALRLLEERASAFQPVGEKRSFQSYFPTVGERCRQRI